MIASIGPYSSVHIDPMLQSQQDYLYRIN